MMLAGLPRRPRLEGHSIKNNFFLACRNLLRYPRRQTCMNHEHQLGVRFQRYVNYEDHIGVRSTRKAYWGHVFTFKCVVWNVQGNSFYLIEMLYWFSPLIDYDLPCSVNKQIIHNPTKEQRKAASS
jgi:hypothetical protein